MSQHQHAFLADTTGEVARVARRVLSMMAAGNWDGVTLGAGQTHLPESRGLSELIKRLYTASYCPDPKAFAVALSDIQNAGYSNNTLSFELIPAVARQLGAAWEDDLISFADVSIGCARLQSALRRVSDHNHDSAAYNGMRQNCLVLVPMGAQHTLGALVLAKQLRQARQHVIVELEADENMLSSLSETQSFDVVMISAARGACPHRLRQLVSVIRQHWHSSKVVIGGSVSDLGCDFIGTLGADHVTKDWQEALDLCI